MYDTELDFAVKSNQFCLSLLSMLFIWIEQSCPLGDLFSRIFGDCFVVVHDYALSNSAGLLCFSLGIFRLLEVYFAGRYCRRRSDFL